MPMHSHYIRGSGNPATSNDPGGMVFAKTEGNMYDSNINNDDTLVKLAETAVTASGGSEAHYNMMPTTTVSFIISLFGTYPARN